MRKIFICVFLYICCVTGCVYAQEESTQQVYPGEEIVSFLSRGDVNITASLFYPHSYSKSAENSQKYPAIILIHGWHGNRYEWMPIVPSLQEEGFVVLALDLRRHGDSGYEKGWKLRNYHPSIIMKKMIYDVSAAYEYLSLLPCVDLNNVSIIGTSIGSALAVQLCEKIDTDKDIPDITSLILVSPAQNYFGIWINKSIRRCKKTPMLFVMDYHDPTPASNHIYKSGSLLYEKIKSEKAKLMFDGVGHGKKMYVQDGFRESVINWILKYKK